MRSHAKASSAGSIEGGGESRGLFRRAFVIRGVASEAKGSGARSLRLLGLAVLLAGIFTALLGAGSAQAYTNYVSSGQIGFYGAFSTPTKIAVDATTGNVLVIDFGQVQVWGPGGTASTQLSGSSFGAGELASPHGLAIDQSNGDVYVSDETHIARYTVSYPNPAEPAVPTYTLDPTYTSPSGGADASSGQVGNFASPIAIDPLNGDLLVADSGNNYVERFDSSGAFVTAFNGADTSAGAFQGLTDIAIGDNGTTYVIDRAAGTSRVERFDGGGVSQGALPGDLARVKSIAYGQRTGNVFVAEDVFNTSPMLRVYVGGVASQDVSYPLEEPFARTAPTGLAVDDFTPASSGRVYGIARETDSGGISAVAVIDVQIQPDATLDPPSDLTPLSAHLSGTVVNPANTGDASFQFEHNILGQGWKPFAQAPTPATVPGDAVDTTSHPEADVSLIANAEYQVRLAATNANGTHTSNVESFTTAALPPGVANESATGLGLSSATLRGSVDPRGLQSTYHFEYGTTAAYGSRAPVDHEAGAGNGRAPLAVAQNISGLEPGTTYHYRLVAENAIGVEAGADQTFTTRSTSSSKRTYELVSPADKNGANVDGIYSQIAADGNAISFTAKSILGNIPVESSPAFIRYTARRSSDGWITKGTDPPQLGKLGPGINYTIGISEDGTKAFVLSRRALAEGAIEGNANTYLRDVLTGAFTTISTTPSLFFFNAQTGIFPSQYVAGTPNFDHVLLSEANLPGAPEAALFEFTEGELREVSLAPDGTPIVGVGQGISDDGSRIFFRSGGVSYVRIDGESTQVISESHRVENAGTPVAGDLLGTSSDGSVAYLFSRDLTEDSEPGVYSLYRYTVANAELEMLTPAPGGAESGSSRATSQWVSDDGSTVYFQEERDLRVWRDGQVSLVASLAPGFETNFNRGMPSPNGRYFVFDSWGPLAGYDNSSDACVGDAYVDAARGCAQVYRYDADAHILTCPSCRPDGEKPTGRANAGSFRFETGAINVDKPHTVDNQGRVFFDTTEQLVAADTNSVSDVYEYDDSGATLISSGHGPVSEILGASADGRDVFFTTQDQLVGIDNDTSIDVYDARIGGGIASQNPPPGRDECIRDDCKATPNQGPELPFGGSEGLSGPANVNEAAKKRCGKGRHARKVKGKQRCVKQKKQQKNRTNGNRRQGR